MKVYIASSWRNSFQPLVIGTLRAMGHDAYDFRNPPARTGFHWSEVDPAWQQWNRREYRRALSHPVSVAGFDSDWGAMQRAEACVLVLPCGRSAHLEAGYFVGAHKPLYILMVAEWIGTQEAELMYKMADAICLDLGELRAALKSALPAEATA